MVYHKPIYSILLNILYELLQELTDACVICKKGFAHKKEQVNLTKKGCSKVNSVSQKLQADLYAVPGDSVHAACRQTFTNKNYVSKHVNKPSTSQSPGMGETDRLTWLMSMPASAHINSVMQVVTGVDSTGNEHHKDTSTARLERDHNDTKKLVDYFTKRNPFIPGETKLRCLASGREADQAVNAHN